MFRNRLTSFEQAEILDYPEIWFLGLEAKKVEGVQGSSQNNGYDDESGSYIKVINDENIYLIAFEELQKTQKLLIFQSNISECTLHETLPVNVVYL